MSRSHVGEEAAAEPLEKRNSSQVNCEISWAASAAAVAADDDDG